MTKMTKIKTNFVINVFVSIVIIRIICLILNIDYNKITVYIADVAFLSVPPMWIIRSDEIKKYTKRKLKNITNNVFYQTITS